MTTKGRQLFDSLWDKRVDPSLLAVLNVGGGEQLIGEVAEGISLLGEHSLLVTNPKRFARLQKMTPQGLTIEFIVGDLDLVESGHIHVHPVLGYRLSEIGPESAESMMAMYLDFWGRKIEHNAAKAGIVTPSQAIVSPLR